jgi:hypothetical protein
MSSSSPAPAHHQQRGLDRVAVAVAAPPVVLLTMALVVLISGALGHHPLWPDSRPTISEAIILRDLGALSQALEARPDLQRRYPVRPGMVTDKALELTPFEAALAARRDDVVGFLAQRNITPSTGERQRLRCLAAQQGAVEVLRLFGGAPATGSCTAAESRVPW